MPRPLPTLVLPCALLALGWVVVVRYNQPRDTAAFETYYRETQSPLFFSHAQEIGFTRVELIKFAPGADGKPAPVYREADVRWDSQEAMDKGVATPGFKVSAADLPNFATGGYTVLVGRKTS
jgi:uncharacterized protein (TIGR02118 family)